ncbi:MAG: hypothetical protein L0Y67_03950 [Gammaproteobacteria bacterium]|nr:hypothetical protein [Gammaproteobacteria bacterium]MCI0590748.1 hypothetical protein [Gammaproteobacteria bacterium]
MPRNTGTGWVLESMIGPALQMGGYKATRQKQIGPRPSGRRHVVDYLAVKGDKKLLVSLKWQQVSGTTEQKVPFEVICLVHAMKQDPNNYSMAYLVLGGDGWSLRDFYVNGGLAEYIDYEDYVRIVTLEQFVALANKGSL